MLVRTPSCALVIGWDLANTSNRVYVGMPRIAQHDVNRSSLEFAALKFENPSMSEITLTQTGILHNPSMYTPTLDSFTAGSYLVTNGTFGAVPIISVVLPKTHATKPKSNQGVVQQVVPIVSLDQLTQYATAVISSEYVETALVGKTNLHLGALPTVKVNYNSTTKYKGMYFLFPSVKRFRTLLTRIPGLNGLAGFNVTNVRINVTAEAGTPNLVGNAYIPNPSVMTIVMGNVTLVLRTEKMGEVGTTTIPNFTLVPGDNNFPMTGILNQTAVLQSLDDGGNGVVTMHIKGQSVTYNGVNLTYYEAALSAHELTLPMNVTQIVRDSLAPAS
jgi:hypothetical protein